MPGIVPEIDPDAAPLALTAANGFRVFSPIKSPSVQAEKQMSSNGDSEGDQPAGSRALNTEITLRVRITSPKEDGDEAAFREAQCRWEQKINKLVEEGGVLRLIYPDGSWIDWEVRDVTGGERLLDNRFVHHQRTEDEVTFVCAPFGVGEEELVGEYELGEAERALDCVVEDIGGSAPALARAVITSPDADVWDLKWGRESRRLSEAPTAAPLYAAADLTPLGGATATTATVDGKAGTAVVRQATLTPNWTALLSTQIDSVGHLTHEGIFEGYLWIHMPTTNAGEVGVGFEYGVGDIVQRIPLAPTYFSIDHPREGKVILLPVGQLFLQAGRNGEHTWEGRVVARSTVAGDKLDVLDFGLRPLQEGNGTISISPALNQPAALLTRDEFNQSAGGLNGKVLAVAGSISGPNSPSVVANDPSGGSVAWASPENGKTVNGGYASATGTGAPNNSNFLKSSKHGLAVPEGSTINGIVLEVSRRRSGGEIRDNSVRLVKAGVAVGTDHSSWGIWPEVDAVATYGSPTDLWGTTWTPAQLTAENFGATLQVAFVNGTGTSLVDGSSIRVYFEDGSGQKWVTSGDAADHAVETTGHTVQRTEVSDADINTGRYAIAGTTVTSDVVVGISSKRGGMEPGSNEKIRRGALAREIDTSNWLQLCIDADYPSAPLTQTIRVVKRVAGTVTELKRLSIPVAREIWQALWLQVDRRGRYFCWGSLMEGGIPRLLLAGQDNDLEEGGALDDGKSGFYDAKTGSLANTRNCDRFVVWIPPLDAAIYQGLSLELTDSTCEREAQGGGVWSPITPQGDYLKLSPAGMENRKNRLVFIASPHDPDLMGVGFPSNLKVAIYATPRYRTVPDPA